MHEAGTTWALVVGIDEYDDPALDRLQGAAADAAAAVGWLRKLGVPDGQILLHAVPCAASRPLLDSLGLPFKPAREGDVWGSLLQLEQQRGSRLFVFLSGHGLFEPETGRLFLTQEARERFWKNLGMDDLAVFLRSLQFPRVFLFLDGCQNYPYAVTARQSITAGLPAGGFTARQHHRLAAGFAAEQGELARELNGRGVFLRHLLAGLDPANPHPEAVVFDYETGARSLDLRVLIDHAVSQVAREVDRQTPGLLPLGWPAAQPIPIVQLPPVETAEVQFLVEPPEAAAYVDQILLTSPDLPTRLKEPHFGGRLNLPLARRLPVAARADAICHLRRGAPWLPSRGTRSFDVTAGQEPVRFPFQPLPPDPPRREVRPERPQVHRDAYPVEAYPVETGPDESFPVRGGGLSYDPGPAKRHREALGAAHGRKGRAHVQLTTRDTSGSTMANQFDYVELAGTLGLPVPEHGAWTELADGVEVKAHETGPEFQIRPDALRQGGLVVTDWMRAIDCRTPSDVYVTVAAPEPVLQPVLRLVLPAGGAAALAGALAGARLLWIGPPDEVPSTPLWREPVPAARSLASLTAEPAVPVDPGPVRIRLDLPWGSWSHLVHAPLLGEVEIALPESVGLPPLRLTLRGEADARDRSQRSQRQRSPVTAILGTAGEAPEGRLRQGLYTVGGALLRNARTAPGPGRASWKLQPPNPPRGEPAAWSAAWSGTELAELTLPGPAGPDGPDGPDGGRKAVFPLLHGRQLGVDLAGGLPRVEPLSAVALPAWDLLIASGRLEGIGNRAVEALLALDREEPLATAAAGYALYASPGGFSAKLLDRVKTHTAEAAGRAGAEAIPDFDLLDLALAARKHNLRSARLQVADPAAWFRHHAAKRLRPWAEAGSVPVLRWGVAIALQLLAWPDADNADSADSAFERWRVTLEGLAPRLSPLSAWTAWTEP